MLSKSQKIASLIIILSLVFPALALGQNVKAVNVLDYTLGSGDTIKISVYDEPDLTVEAKLSESGVLTYPFLGTLQVVGLTVGELQNNIANGLRGDYLIDPRVLVNVVEYRPFYIYGQVKQPGGYPYQAGLTVERAISLATGFTERASKRSAYIVSENASDQKPRKVDLNAPVKPGDVITIEESFF